MITHDTGRYLGCYGHNDVHSPELDQLAENGVQFNEYYCPAPQCSPSRGSILSGKYPHNNGLIGLAHLDFTISEETKLLPHYFSEGGYETALIGFSHETIGEEDFGVYSSKEKLGYEKYIGVEGSRSPEVADKAIDYLKEKAATKDGKPFYANIGFWETHRTFDEYEEMKANANDIEVPDYLPDTPQIREDLALFHGSIKVLDEAVGRVMRALRDLELDQNTIVVFTTDHGIAFPRAKGTFKTAGLETALLMSGPMFKKGRKLDQLLCNVDMLPTLIELAGLDIPDGIDGTSFKHLLLDEEGTDRDSFFCELTWHDKYHPMRGIRTAQYQYVKNLRKGPKIYMPVDIHRSPSGPAVQDEYYVPNEPEELYDVVKDPYQDNNLASNPEYATVLADLREKVLHWMEQTDDPLLKGDVAGTESKKWAEETKKGNTFEAKYMN